MPGKRVEPYLAGTTMRSCANSFMTGGGLHLARIAENTPERSSDPQSHQIVHMYDPDELFILCYKQNGNRIFIHYCQRIRCQHSRTDSYWPRGHVPLDWIVHIVRGNAAA